MHVLCVICCEIVISLIISAFFPLRNPSAKCDVIKNLKYAHKTKSHATQQSADCQKSCYYQFGIFFFPFFSFFFFCATFTKQNNHNILIRFFFSLNFIDFQLKEEEEEQNQITKIKSKMVKIINYILLLTQSVLIKLHCDFRLLPLCLAYLLLAIHIYI